MKSRFPCSQLMAYDYKIDYYSLYMIYECTGVGLCHPEPTYSKGCMSPCVYLHSHNSESWGQEELRTV